MLKTGQFVFVKGVYGEVVDASSYEPHALVRVIFPKHKGWRDNVLTKRHRLAHNTPLQWVSKNPFVSTGTTSALVAWLADPGRSRYGIDCVDNEPEADTEPEDEDESEEELWNEANDNDAETM